MIEFMIIIIKIKKSMNKIDDFDLSDKIKSYIKEQKEYFNID
jgi:hypothetical protein